MDLRWNCKNYEPDCCDTTDCEGCAEFKPKEKLSATQGSYAPTGHIKLSNNAMKIDTGRKITLVCAKGHRCEVVEGTKTNFTFYIDGIEVYKTKRICFQCLGEFIDKNIPEMKEVLNG